MRAWITHGYYGCDTGCCGHTVYFEGDEYGVWAGFQHPWDEPPQAWGERVIREIAAERGITAEIEIDWLESSISND